MRNTSFLKIIYKGSRGKRESHFLYICGTSLHYDIADVNLFQCIHILVFSCCMFHLNNVRVGFEIWPLAKEHINVIDCVNRILFCMWIVQLPLRNISHLPPL